METNYGYLLIIILALFLSIFIVMVYTSYKEKKAKKDSSDRLKFLDVSLVKGSVLLQKNKIIDTAESEKIIREYRHLTAV
jgi:hypothetical protein